MDAIIVSSILFGTGMFLWGYSTALKRAKSDLERLGRLQSEVEEG